jgi:lysophospholipase L1-like esterase
MIFFLWAVLLSLSTKEQLSHASSEKHRLRVTIGRDQDQNNSPFTAGRGLKKQKQKQIVVLGDSVIAGVGARNPDGLPAYDPSSALCLRSPYSYAAQYVGFVQHEMGTKTKVTLTNEACSAARIFNVSEQVIASGLNQQTDLILMQFGVNDVGAVPALYVCFVPGLNGSLDKCKASISDARAALPTMQAQATDLLISIASKLRKGVKVVVLGYPNIVTEKPYILKKNVTNGTSIEIETFDAAKATLDGIAELNQAIKASVQAANKKIKGKDVITFVPLKDLFRGHEVDPSLLLVGATNPDAWFHGIHQYDALKLERWHFNPYGHANLSKYLFDTFGTFGV